MTILSRYVAKDFLKVLFICLLAMILLLIVANMFYNLESIFSSWGKFFHFLDSALRRIPTILEIILPFSVLLATVVTFNGFSRSSELIAMKSSGLGNLRMIMPICLLLIPISMLGYLNQNYLYTALNPDLTQSPVKQQHYQWRSSGKEIFYLTSIQPQKNSISNGYVFRWISDPFSITEMLRFSQGTRSNGKWQFQDVYKGFKINQLWNFEQIPKLEIPAERFPDFFKSIDLDAHHMPFFDLFGEIRQLNKRDPQVVVYLLEWYQKIAVMFAPFIMVLVGAPLSQFHIRKGKVAGEIVITIFGGIVYWISNEIFLVLGKGGFINPFVAAWGINVIFIILGLALLWRTR